MNSRQLFKLIGLLLFSSISYYLALRYNDNIFSKILVGLKAAPGFMLSANAAFAIFFITYTVSISKSISEIKDKTNNNSINKFITSVNILNQEVISNTILVFIAYVVLKCIDMSGNVLSALVLDIYLKSFQFSMYIVILFVTFNQLIALKSAMNYSEIIDKNKTP